MDVEGELNRKKAVLGFRDEGGDWYALDNAAIIMPAVSRGVDTSLFRLSATLRAPVRLAALQAALDRTAARFPYFVVELRRGFFWHHLVPHRRRPRVEADPTSPCQGFDMGRRGTLLFRVRARDRTIACEYSHIITDGTGGLRFLKNLVAEYLRQIDGGAMTGSDPDLLDLDAPPDPEETEDAYNRHYPGRYPFPPAEPFAFHLGGPLLPKGSYRVTTGVIPLAPALAKAREFGVSLTELLVAAYLEALQNLWFAAPERERRRASTLSVEVPVNMRAFCPTRSNRNFSLFVHASLDLRLGRREFPEIVAKVHHQLRHDIDLQGMKRHMTRNVRGGRALFIRAIPLVLKAPVMKYLYARFGMSIISGVLSNLGAVTLPEPYASSVERFTIAPPPSRLTRTGAVCLSWKDRLFLSFGSLGRERELERLVFTRLQALGLDVALECNFEES